MQHKSLGDYELLDELGAGTVGTVFRAKHSQTGDIVALKLLKGSFEKDQNVQERFVREVTILEKLDHENIVEYLDCGFDKNILYFTMEYIDSGSLKEVMQGQIPWRDAVELGEQVCAAIAHAHEQGVVHRDLKPANLFLSGEGRVKVGDFGIALDVERSRLTADGLTVGTCRYMAPEQIMAEEISPQTDLYSLGCILFQMITGRFLFDGETDVEIIEKHLQEQPPNISEFSPSSPPELNALLARLLAKDPADRPESATAVRNELLALLNPASTPDRGPAQANEVQESGSAAGDEQNLTQRLQNVQPAGKEASWSVLAVIVTVLVGVVVACWALT